MTRTEIRAVVSIALLYALRLFGLFLIIPIFAIYLMTLSGHSHLLVGLAFGIYGVAQACMQIPMGWFSDQIGRKPVIAVGLVLFGAGSFLCANATTIHAMIWGRLLQGIGAYGSVVTVMLPDFIEPERRGVVSAGIGILIGIVFSLSLILSPVLNHWIGVSGIFSLMGFSVIFALLVLYALMPAEPFRPVVESTSIGRSIATVLSIRSLRVIICGVFILNMNFASFWIVLPPHLRQLGVQEAKEWKIYLPVIMLSFIFSGFSARFLRQDKPRYSLMTVSVLMLIVSFMLLMIFYAHLSIVVFSMFLFFMSLMFFEAFFPALVFSHAPLAVRGTAVAVFTSAEFLGVFAGSILSSTILQFGRPTYVFGVSALIFLGWCLHMLPIYKEVLSMPDRGDQWRKSV